MFFAGVSGQILPILLTALLPLVFLLSGSKGPGSPDSGTTSAITIPVAEFSPGPDTDQGGITSLFALLPEKSDRVAPGDSPPARLCLFSPRCPDRPHNPSRNKAPPSVC
jgi:hypothetical protein